MTRRNVDRSVLLVETTTNVLRHFPEMTDDELYDALETLDTLIDKYVGRADRELRLREIITIARNAVNRNG